MLTVKLRFSLSFLSLHQNLVSKQLGSGARLLLHLFIYCQCCWMSLHPLMGNSCRITAEDLFFSLSRSSSDVSSFLPPPHPPTPPLCLTHPCDKYKSPSSFKRSLSPSLPSAPSVSLSYYLEPPPPQVLLPPFTLACENES